jgi:membrane associated rhomboid family serine protease
MLLRGFNLILLHFDGIYQQRSQYIIMTAKFKQHSNEGTRTFARERKNDILDAIRESTGEENIFSSSSSSESHPSDLSTLGCDSLHPKEDDVGSNRSEDTDVSHDGEAEQERERLKFFLRCFDLASAPQDGIAGVHTTTEYNKPHMDIRIRHSSPKSNSSLITSTSLFDDPEVLTALRRSLRCPGGLAEGLDPTIAIYVKLFEFAQRQRHKKYRINPYGILGLFRNLSDIRSDLLWAQDAVHRRDTAKPYVAWIDYYRKEEKGLHFPYFSAIMTLTSVFMMILAFDRNGWQIESLHVNALIGPSPEVLLRLGALQGRYMIESKEWWRLLTPMLLHAGVIHLVINIACIGLLARHVERSHGSLRTSVLFTISSVGGNMISALMQPGFVLVGASGGIFGLMGVCVADIVLNWRLLFLIFDQRPTLLAGRFQNEENRSDQEAIKIEKRLCCPPNYNLCRRLACGTLLCLDILINSVVGFTPLVDNFAHLGGMAYGFLLSLSSLTQLPLGFVDQAQQRAPVLRFCQNVRIFTLRSLGTICVMVLLMISTVLISQSNGFYSPCLPCRYLSCIPFPFWVSEDKRWWNCDMCDGVFAQAYQWSGSPIISDLELYCPQGYTKNIDISDFMYRTFDTVDEDLEIICKRECK